MSIKKMFLDEKLFINMYLNNDLDKLYNVDVFIVSDKKTDKLLDLFREGKTKELKKILSKNVKPYL
jgi:hypothetical protein